MRLALVAAVTSVQVLQMPILSYGFHVQSPDGQSNGTCVSGPNMPWYTAPMMLVSLTLSDADQLAAFSTNTRMP